MPEILAGDQALVKAIDDAQPGRVEHRLGRAGEIGGAGRARVGAVSGQHVDLRIVGDVRMFVEQLTEEAAQVRLVRQPVQRVVGESALLEESVDRTEAVDRVAQEQQVEENEPRRRGPRVAQVVTRNGLQLGVFADERQQLRSR